jgi:membrane protease YdiL (CAAX protease family)
MSPRDLNGSSEQDYRRQVGQPRADSESRALPRLVRAHPLVAYFVITYALSWSYWAFTLGVLKKDSLWWFLPGAFAPFIAAVIVTGLTHGREGLRAYFRRFVLWRVGVRWYLFALVALPLLIALLGLPFRDGSEGVTGSFVQVAGIYVAYVVFLSLLGGGQEEPGWRGFALPRLQVRYGPLFGTVVLGLLWGVWHLPLFVFVADYNSAGTGWPGIALTFAAFVVGGAVGQSLLLTWLFNHTKGSVLLAILAHGSLNTAQAFFVATNREASITVFLLLLVAGLAVAAATRGRLGYGSLPPSEGKAPSAPSTVSA